MHESAPDVDSLPAPDAPDTAPYPLPIPAALHPRIYRSPKRTFDESSASSESSQSAAKRVRGTPSSSSLAPTAAALDAKLAQIRANAELEADTPPLSTAGSPLATPGSPVSTMSSLSTLSSREDTPPVPEFAPAATLTKRDRKRLGLPKRVGGVRAGVSAGKIVIPGGRYRRPAGQMQMQSKGAEGEVGSASGGEEWMKNGAGRVDVRGFRELRI